MVVVLAYKVGQTCNEAHLPINSDREKEQFGDVLWYSHLIVKTRLLLIKSFVLRRMS